MGRYLFTGKYTSEGTKGLKKDSATARREVVSNVAASVGGRLESFYFAFGETDTFTILDLPSPEAALALVLAINESGGAVDTTTVLFTPEEVDEALKLPADYRAPGT